MIYSNRAFSKKEVTKMWNGLQNELANGLTNAGFLVWTFKHSL